MVGRSPQCYIPSFIEISPLVHEKMIFEGFLSYMGDSTVQPKNTGVENKLLFFFLLKLFFSPKTTFSIKETIYERDK